jgi:hypothetical protein
VQFIQTSAAAATKTWIKKCAFKIYVAMALVLERARALKKGCVGYVAKLLCLTRSMVRVE